MRTLATQDIAVGGSLDMGAEILSVHGGLSLPALQPEKPRGPAVPFPIGPLPPVDAAPVLFDGAPVKAGVKAT